MIPALFVLFIALAPPPTPTIVKAEPAPEPRRSSFAARRDGSARMGPIRSLSPISARCGSSATPGSARSRAASASPTGS